MDLTRLPIAGMLVSFLLMAIGVTFVFAFMATSGGGGPGEAIQTSPSPPVTPPPSGSPSTGNMYVLTLGDNFFDKTQFTVGVGQAVTFQITSKGSATHNVHLAGPGNEFSEDFCNGKGEPCSAPPVVKGGKSATLQWTAPSTPGELKFRCDFHPVQMNGTIKIQ